ncbi:50S ribosomal protein L35 [Candidatus Vidania fulgoroideorum]
MKKIKTKTNKSYNKRFFSNGCNIKHHSNYMNHLLTKKSSKRKRRLKKTIFIKND